MRAPTSLSVNATSKQRQRHERSLDSALDEINAMPVTTPAERAASYAAMEAWKSRNSELCRVYGPARAAQPAPAPVVVPRVDRRPRERREQRHAARSTSSGDSGSDPDEPEPPEGGRLCAAPWCNHTVVGARQKVYCGTERCAQARAAERQRKVRHGDIGDQAFADAGEHSQSFLWRFALVAGLDPGEFDALLIRSCRCNGHHIDGGIVGCFKCGLPREAVAA